MRGAPLLAASGLAVLACGFGVFDARLQDIGGGGADTVISNMSAAYLVLAFGTGWLAARVGTGASVALVAGLVVTMLALGSFYGWQISEASVPPALAAHESYDYVIGGTFTGPAFGWLGHQWARRRAWYAATAVVVAFLCERYAWAEHLGFSVSPAWPWDVEQVIGVVLGAASAVAILRHRGTRS